MCVSNFEVKVNNILKPNKIYLGCYLKEGFGIICMSLSWVHLQTWAIKLLIAKLTVI